MIDSKNPCAIDDNCIATYFVCYMYRTTNDIVSLVVLTYVIN